MCRRTELAGAEEGAVEDDPEHGAPAVRRELLGLDDELPAASLTRVVTGPSASSAAANAASTCSGSRTSQETATPPPIAATVSSSGSGRRPHTATLAPAGGAPAPSAPEPAAAAGDERDPPARTPRGASRLAPLELVLAPTSSASSETAPVASCIARATARRRRRRAPARAGASRRRRRPGGCEATRGPPHRRLQRERRLLGLLDPDRALGEAQPHQHRASSLRSPPPVSSSASSHSAESSAASRTSLGLRPAARPSRARRTPPPAALECAEIDPHARLRLRREDADEVLAPLRVALRGGRDPPQLLAQAHIRA